MGVASEKLLEFIENEGSISGTIITVEKFLNHKINPDLIKIICGDFLNKFNDKDFNKILTVESSGIVFASYISFLTGKDFVFIKKKRPITMKEYYFEKSFSFTKKAEINLFLSKRVVNSNDRFLFVDDFYANGNTYKSVVNLVKQAQAEIVGSAVVINKSDNKDIYSILCKEDLGIDSN